VQLTVHLQLRATKRDDERRAPVLGMPRIGTSFVVAGVRQPAGIDPNCFRSYPTTSRFTSNTPRSSASATRILVPFVRLRTIRALCPRDRTVIPGSSLFRRRLKDVLHHIFSDTVSRRYWLCASTYRPTCCCRHQRKRNIRGDSLGVSNV
jgi:hypothetical protein